MPERSNILEPPLVDAASARFPHVVLVAMVLAHSALLLFLPFKSPQGFYNSPDEMANAMFAGGVQEDGHLARPVVRPELPDSVVPRGVSRRGKYLVPVGFASFPLVLGLAAKAVSLAGLPFLLAALGGAALFAWYGFLRPLFGTRIARTATLLLAVHPLVLYWGARPFMPNAFFISLAIIALFFLSRAPLRRTYITAGVFWGLAIAIRPHEGLWLAFIPLVYCVKNSLRPRSSWALFFAAAAIPIGGLFALQAMLYGSPLHTGYHLTPASMGVFELVASVLLPFGFDARRVGLVAMQYGLGMAPWFTALWIGGSTLIVHRGNGGPKYIRLRRFVMAQVGLAFWLLLYYGSFQFYDRFDHALFSLGNSFTRYFLPLSVMTTIPAAYALLWMYARLGRTAAVMVFFITSVLSLRLVVWSTDESWISIVRTLRENQEIKARALESMPSDGILLTERSDKVFYPERQVVTVFKSPKFSQSRFTELYPFNLYYETIAGVEAVAMENRKFWEPHGLRAVDPVDLGYRHTLYKLSKF